MEDPATRKERLRAMRTEASQVNASAETSISRGHLSNPLAETSGALLSQEESYQTQRFDYYTDPLSAFSSNKRNKTDQRIEQHYSSSPSNQMGSPVSQFQPSIPGPVGSAHQAHNIHGGFQAGHYESRNLHIDPRGMTLPSPLHHGTPQEGWNNFRPPANDFRPFQSLYPVPRTFHNHRGISDPGNRFGGRGNYNRPQNPNYARPFPNYRQQNGNWAGRTSPVTGRGNGGTRCTNPSFGRNGGNQQKYDQAGHQAPGPECFYDSTMAEDPWKHLEPVLWKSCSHGSTSSSTGQAWLPKKKPTAPEAANRSSNTRQSLAEYLAASLDEATCDQPSN